MKTLGYVFILVSLLLVRGLTRGRGITQLPGDLGDLFVAMVGADQAGLQSVLSRTGDSQTVDAHIPNPITDPAAASLPSGTADPGGEAKLAPNAVKVRRALLSNWPGTVVGGYRAGAGAQDHGTGHALDAMCDKAKGDQIATWAIGLAKPSVVPGVNTNSLVQYVIWQQKIWNKDRAGEGWRPMADRGSPTQNHMDHVHISVT